MRLLGDKATLFSKLLSYGCPTEIQFICRFWEIAALESAGWQASNKIKSREDRQKRRKCGVIWKQFLKIGMASPANIKTNFYNQRIKQLTDYKAAISYRWSSLLPTRTNWNVLSSTWKTTNISPSLSAMVQFTCKVLGGIVINTDKQISTMLEFRLWNWTDLNFGGVG